jgi:GMP synthase (glutamine-hydrolysing)
MNKPTKPVLILKMGPTIPHLASRRGEFDDWIAAPFREQAVPTAVVAPYAGETLPRPESYAAVVISGSHAFVTDMEPWSKRVADWIPDVIIAEVPLLGICYGHQLMALGLGGTVGNSPVGIEMGTVALKLRPPANDDLLFGGLPGAFKAHASHAQSVLALPSDAVVLACNPAEPHHAFAIGQSAWGLQFHPEFDADIMRAYVTEFAHQLKHFGYDPNAIQQRIAETPLSRQILERFARIAKQNLS